VIALDTNILVYADNLIFCPLTRTLSRQGRENPSPGSFKKRNILSD